MLAIKEALSDVSNLFEQLTLTYGETYRKIYEPLLQKFFNTDVSNSPNTMLAGLSLLLIKTPHETRELKKDGFNNARIDFIHSMKVFQGYKTFILHLVA